MNHDDIQDASREELLVRLKELRWINAQIYLELSKVRTTLAKTAGELKRLHARHDTTEE